MGGAGVRVGSRRKEHPGCHPPTYTFIHGVVSALSVWVGDHAGWHYCRSGGSADSVCQSAALATARQYTMQPLAWLREWESVLSERVGNAQAGRAPVAQAAAVITVRTLGTFQLVEGENDLTSELLSHSVLCYLWLYLL